MGKAARRRFGFKKGDNGSPLKDKPLRNPGQSLDEALDRLSADELLPYVLFPGVFWILALIEWVARSTGMPRSPVLYAIFAVSLTAWSIWRIGQLRRVVRDFKLGRDGERAVGQFLEGLRADGAQVFHDVPGIGFNVDHVVISTRGIFVVETKTWRKRRPDSRVSVKEGKLYRDGTLITPNPIEQAKAEAKWIRKVLQESTGKTFQVRGVVVFPGWFVEPMDAATKSQAWVLEPKALPAFIEEEPPMLATSDVALAAYHLSRYVRANYAGT
jgi:hypothetical protein